MARAHKDGVPDAPLVAPAGSGKVVSGLLCFHNLQDEAYISSFQRSQKVNDALKMNFGLIGNVLLCLRLLLNGNWLSAGAAMAEVAMLATYRWLSFRAPLVYLHHRSLIVGSVFSLHALTSGLIAPSVVSPGCPTPLMFWLREINLSQVLWISLISLVMPVPLKHAVLAQAAVVGVMLCTASRRHHLSSSLCALSDARYQQVAAAIGAAAACVLPAPLGAAAMKWAGKRLGSAAFYVVDAAMQLVVVYCMVLGVQYRAEWRQRWRQRYAFARRRGLAAEMRGLRACRDCWHLSASAIVLGAALLWLSLSACAMLQVK